MNDEKIIEIMKYSDDRIIFKTNCIYEFEEEISTNDINLSLIAREDKFISTRKRKESSPGDRLRDNFVIFAQSLNNI